MSLVHVADNVFCLCLSLSSEREGVLWVQVVLLCSASASGSLMFPPEFVSSENKELLCI